MRAAIRLVAGVTGVAVACLVATPASAASNTTLVLDSALMSALGSNDVSVTAIEPARLSGMSLTMPASSSGKRVSNRGGFELASSAGYVSLTSITLNHKTGKASALIGSAYNEPEQEQVKNLLVFRGGKNTVKKNGRWSNAKVSLAKSAVVGGEAVDPAVLLSSSLQVPVGTVAPGQKLGKATIRVKR